MVIEEVTAIQENLEIERACRESAEALASKVHFIFRQILSKQWTSGLSYHLCTFYVTDIV